MISSMRASKKFIDVNLQLKAEAILIAIDIIKLSNHYHIHGKHEFLHVNLFFVTMCDKYTYNLN